MSSFAQDIVLVHTQKMVVNDFTLWQLSNSYYHIRQSTGIHLLLKVVIVMLWPDKFSSQQYIKSLCFGITGVIVIDIL